MHYRGNEGKKNGIVDIKTIEVPIISYDGYKKLNPKFKSGKFTVNSYGFRGKEFDVAKKQGIFRIVALGGSTTMGMDADDTSYPAFLEKILNAKTRRQCEVINAGYGGANIGEIAKLLKAEIVNLNPDLIVINSVFNNLFMAPITYKFNYLQKFNLSLAERSLFYMTLREKTAVVFHKPVANLYKVSVKQMRDNFMSDKRFWADLEYAYNDIVKTAKLHRIGVIIINEPVWIYSKNQYRYILLDKELEPVFKNVYSLFVRIAKENENVHAIDVASYFVSEKYFSSDGVHLTPEGDKYMAGIIANAIIDIYMPKVDEKYAN